MWSHVSQPTNQEPVGLTQVNIRDSARQSQQIHQIVLASVNSTNEKINVYLCKYGNNNSVSTDI